MMEFLDQIMHRYSLVVVQKTVNSTPLVISLYHVVLVLEASCNQRRFQTEHMRFFRGRHLDVQELYVRGVSETRKFADTAPLTTREALDLTR